MARRIWQGDFARFWFGFRSARDGRRPAAGSPGSGGAAGPLDDGTLQTPDRPLGIVARNRQAQRERWALRGGTAKN